MRETWKHMVERSYDAPDLIFSVTLMAIAVTVTLSFCILGVAWGLKKILG